MVRDDVVWATDLGGRQITHASRCADCFSRVVIILRMTATIAWQQAQFNPVQLST
jgi:hypothetical protein